MNRQLTKVLGVSGCSENLRLYELIIAHNGIKNLQFVGALDGREGFQKAVQIKPDLIISEGYLSDVGDYNFEFGWSLSEKIRCELNPHILAVIILERWRDYDWDPTDNWVKWTQAPLNGVLMKPVSPDELRKMVNLLLDVVDRTRAQQLDRE